MNGRVGRKRPDSDGAVGAASHKGGGAHLKLADKGRVTLENSLAGSERDISWMFEGQLPKESIPIMRVPYPNTGVKAPCCDSLPVKCDGVDLAEMALQRT